MLTPMYVIILCLYQTSQLTRFGRVAQGFKVLSHSHDKMAVHMIFIKTVRILALRTYNTLYTGLARVKYPMNKRNFIF